MSFLRFLLPALALAWAAPAFAQTVISSVPYVVSQSGRYVLGGNLVTASASQVAITISAPNVVLDLNGFYVSGPGNDTASTTAVVSVGNVSNVTIRNGTIANNAYGISFGSGANSINHLVEDVNVTRCLISGVYFGGITASSVVRRNTITLIGGYTGGPTNTYGIYSFTGVRIENNFVNTVVSAGGSSRGIDQDVGCFAIGNTVANCSIGIKSGKYQDNLTFNCPTPFTIGTNAGGND